VVRPGGLILLLEHGRGTSEKLNSMLDKGADQRFEKWGCWWNRDILGIVHEVWQRC
jgi:methyltransferase OMS1